VSNLITDLKRAWRLTKLIRSTELTDEDALQIEKVHSIYIEGCREIRTSLDKARKSLNRNVKTSRLDNDKRLAKFEDSLSSSITKISQLLDASQKAAASRLGIIEESTKTTQELVNDVREFVATKSDETRRWQEGYDWRILKNYLTRVISTLDDIETKLEKYQNENKPQEFLKDFEFLRETLEIHLEEEGLLGFAPLIGADVDPARADIKGVIESTAEDQRAETVAEVVKKGYEIDLGAGVETVRRAQVTVYKK
jgi:molecular chaperone GrpE (heat shock protein)